MEHNRLNSLLITLSLLYKEGSQNPFPYDDCWKVTSKYGELYQDLTADLNTYFMDIEGYCSWGVRIKTWPITKVNDIWKKQSKSFFVKYPQYEPLKSDITILETPDLFSQMSRYEDMRLTLQQALFCILTVTQSQTGLSNVTTQKVQLV